MYGVLFLLDFQDLAIFECPLDNVGIGGCALDGLARGESGPEIGEVLEPGRAVSVQVRAIVDLSRSTFARRE